MDSVVFFGNSGIFSITHTVACLTAPGTCATEYQAYVYKYNRVQCQPVETTPSVYTLRQLLRMEQQC